MALGKCIDPDQVDVAALYREGLLVLPDVWRYCGGSAAELYEFHKLFGAPWRREDYRCSLEHDGLLPNVDITHYVDGGYTKLGTHEIPWHSDVPIYRDQYLNWPIRSLTAWRLPENPAPTSFCSTFALYDALDAGQREFAGQVILTYQSWHWPGTAFTEMPLVQTHPVSGRRFLALNSYNRGRPDSASKAWIVKARLAGEAGPARACSELLSPYDEMIEDLAYHHRWEYGQMVLFDNTGMLHKRSAAVDPSDPRKFFRINVRHRYQDEQRLQGAAPAAFSTAT